MMIIFQMKVINDVEIEYDPDSSGSSAAICGYVFCNYADCDKCDIHYIVPKLMGIVYAHLVLDATNMTDVEIEFVSLFFYFCKLFSKKFNESNFLLFIFASFFQKSSQKLNILF